MVRLIRYGKPGGGPPVLAIPGIDGSEGSVLPMVQKLAERREVVIVDYEAEDNATLEALTFQIVTTVRRELRGRITVMGQSIGTIVASKVAGLGALDVGQVILVGTFLRLRSAALWLSNAVSRAMPAPVYRAVSAPLMGLVCGPVGDGRSHPFFAASRASNPVGVARRTGWEIGQNFEPDLAKVRQPTLVLMGERDRFVPDVRRQIADLRRVFDRDGSKVVAVPDAGHVFLPSAAIAQAVGEMESFLA
jgi:pimeloyl-ACP methyl ester carboxylesterase